MPSYLTALPDVAGDAAPGLFSCTWQRGYGARWATLGEELDACTAPLLDDSLHDAEADADLIVVDLRNLAFMDCAGMRVVSQSSERLRQSGRLMVVVRGRGPADRVLTLTRAAGATQLFELEPEEPEFEVLLKLVSIDRLLARRTDLFGDLDERKVTAGRPALTLPYPSSHTPWHRVEVSA